MDAMYYTQTYENNGRPVTNPILIDGMRAGVDRAWGHLYSVYWNWLFQLTLGMGVRRQDAEDLVQKTFIALAKNISQFIYEPARGRFSGWLITVLRRNVYSFWERESKDPLRLCADSPEESTQLDHFKGSAGLENHVISEVMANDLKQVIEESYVELRSRVSDEQWQMFDLYNLQDRPVEEVASRFNRKSGSIYSNESRMMHKLGVIMHQKMQEAYGDEVFAEHRSLLEPCRRRNRSMQQHVSPHDPATSKLGF